MKLLSVERHLEIFPRKGENLVAEIPITLDIEILKAIVKSRKNDNLLYMNYGLNKHQVSHLLNLANIDMIVEYKTYRYYLSCVGVYDYNKDSNA